MSRPAAPASPAITPAALRAAVARDGRPLYVLAAECAIHPGTLGRLLNGAVPLTPEQTARILAVVRDPDAAA